MYNTYYNIVSMFESCIPVFMHDAPTSNISLHLMHQLILIILVPPLSPPTLFNILLLPIRLGKSDANLPIILLPPLFSPFLSFPPPPLYLPLLSYLSTYVHIVHTNMGWYNEKTTIIVQFGL